MDKDTILTLRVVELKEKLRELQLSTQGRKQTLQDRLLEHYGLEIEEEEELESEINIENKSDKSEDDNESHNSDNSNSQSVKQITKHERIFTLNDIRESLDYFDGINKPDVERWLENFEENALSVNWDDLQKFLYAKQLIKGAARIFMRSQNNINNWATLRKALLNEFGKKFSSIEIHKALQNRRKKNSESYLEYLYSLMEMGSGINVDEQSLIEYFIDGISDSRLNK